MKASFERLIDGSAQALDDSMTNIKSPDFAFLISCIGRRRALQQRTEHEIDAVTEVLKKTCAITGFYAYWEINSSIWKAWDCHLQNRTMTITVFKEV